MYVLKMRFKVSMINNLDIWHEKTVFANNQSEAKGPVKTYDPKLRLLDAKWFNK